MHTLFLQYSNLNCINTLFTYVIFTSRVIEWLRAKTTKPPFRVKFSSLSESTQTSQADCVMWKDVPVLFFPSKQGEKTWQTGLKFCPPPPPPPHCSSLLTKCWIWTHEIWTLCARWQKTAKTLLTSFGGTEGGGGWGLTFVPVCQVFSRCFQGKTTQEHLFT